MVVTCEEVWREISNYLEGDVEPSLRLALEEHVRGCKRCAAVLEGTRNVVQLYGDERMFEVPLGFSHRLHEDWKKICLVAGDAFWDGWSPQLRQPGRRQFRGG